MKILVVDDDAVTVNVVGVLLRYEGHEVDTCARGEEALERLGAARYEVLLTDLVMSGMSGVELVQRARELDGALRCAIISGHTDRDAAEPGGTTWLSKPLDFDALLTTIDAWSREGRSSP